MILPAEHAASLYDERTLAHLRSLAPGMAAIASLAGRDSVAAIVQAVRERGFTTIIPTSVATGTEFGSLDEVHAALAYTRDVLGPDIDVLDVVRFGSPQMWAALNGRFASEVRERYGMSSPCLSCHLYVHLARVPLALDLGGLPVITGERDTHDGAIKLSQTIDSIDAEVRVLAHAGVELLVPIREFSHAQVDTLVPGWNPGERQLSCVHSGNYRRADGTTDYDRAAHQRYVEGFYEPAGRAIVDAWLGGDRDPDYEAIVRGVIAG